MATRNPATNHDEIIAVVADLRAQMAQVLDNQMRFEGKIDALTEKVSAHDDAIRDWRRIGKWAGWLMTGFGALVATFAHNIYDVLSPHIK